MKRTLFAEDSKTIKDSLHSYFNGKYYNETYTYSNISTGNAILAGITTGIIGGLVYNGLKHHHKKAPIIRHKSDSHHGHNSGHKKHH